MAIHWEDSMKTGVPVIDRQHEEIFVRFEELSRTIEDGGDNAEICRLIDYLDQYAGSHFADEENLMALYNYPGIEEQRMHHQKFKENVDTLSTMLASNTPAKDIAIKVNATLIRYFINHVRTMDREMVDFLHSNGNG